jgi:Glycosyltransferase family 10 (fucosyltransferase) C-term
MGLIAMQLLVLVRIGFSVPSVSDELQRATTTDVAVRDRNGQGDSGGNPKNPSHKMPATTSTKQHKQPNESHLRKHVPNQRRNSTEAVVVSAAASSSLGPFDIPGAYYANFQLQREMPKFRTLDLPKDDQWLQRLDLLSQQFTTTKSYQPCYYYQNHRMLVRPECQSALGGQSSSSTTTATSTVTMVAYNSLDHVERTWCGQTIEPHTAQIIPKSGGCQEPVKVFPHDSPPLSGEGMAPIEFRRLAQDGTPSSSKKELNSFMVDQCSVGCHVTNTEPCHTIDCLPPVSNWNIGGTTWNFKIYHKIPGLKVDRKAYRNFSFSASQSFQADVPLSTFRWDRDGGETPSPPVNFDTTEKAISFLDSNTCMGRIRASSWAEAMKEKMKLASYGNCVPTTQLPAGMSLQNEADRTKLLQKHMFTLIVEDTIENDFITDALWEALHAGVIPVYYGASNVASHVPRNSFVSASEIGTKEGTADRIVEIANNKALWETYHAWRKEPFPEHLKQKFQFLRTTPFCRICKWAYAKRYGLGWNHPMQEIQAPTIARDACISSEGLWIRPFRETWVFSTSSTPDVIKTAAAASCSSTVMTHTIQADSFFTLTRTMSQHDSIVDIIIPEAKSTNGELLLRLHVPINNWEGAHFRHVHQMIASQNVALYSSIAIQDSTSRMTVLTNWPTQLRSPTHGIVEIVVQETSEEKLFTNEIRRIRILIEDISSLRDVKTEYGTSPFAMPLIQDFLNPLELFYVAAS